MKTGFRSIGEVRSLAPSEMQPIYGSYRQSLSGALKELLFQALLMTAIAFIAAASSLPPGWRIVAFPIAILMAAFFGLGIWMQVNTVRIVGPDSFGVKSSIDRFSWQVPVEEIERCQLIQASPHNKLRIIKQDGSAKSLPVTRDLWDSIMSITPTG